MVRLQQFTEIINTKQTTAKTLIGNNHDDSKYENEVIFVYNMCKFHKI